MATKKRVLFWQETFLPNIGGVEVLAPKLLSGLRQRGYEFTVVTRDDHLDQHTESDCDGIPVHRYPITTAYMGGNLEQLLQMRSQVARLKRTFAPDLVHLNLFGPSALFHYDTASVHRAPVLLTLHSTKNTMLQHSCAANGLFRKALRSAQWVACVSAAVLDHWRQMAPEISSYSSVIYNGFAAPDLAPGPLPLEPPRLLCLGRLSREKGFDLALSAFASILGRFPQARLVMAGDGPERGALEKQAAQLNLTHAVEWLGWIAPENVAGLLTTVTMILLPSRYEGLPSVAVEAALMGRPVVATKVGGLAEVVRHGSTGLLVPVEDSAALARSIEYLLNHPQKAASFGNAARPRAQEQFAFDQYIARYHALYQQLFASGQRAG